MMGGPLSGVRVLDAANMIAGPSTAALMADLGADVIKLEPPRGDLLRGMIAVDGGPDPWWQLDNRGKRGIAVDLTSEDGVDVVHRIVDTVDVLLTNLTMARQRRFRLTAEELLDRHPGLVHASITGYGTDGPDADRLAFDHTAFFARGGVQWVMGEPGATPPAGRAGQGDHTTALALLSSILLALRHRDATGRGQAVEVALMQVAMWTLSSDLAVGMATGEIPDQRLRLETPSPLVCRFRCADERWIAFCMPGGDLWPAFCDAVGRTEWLDDERYSTAEARAENAGELISACDEIFAGADLATWAQRCDAAGLTWGPIQTLQEVLDDPQAAALGAFGEVPGLPGRFRTVNGPFHLSASAAGVRDRAPGHGEHTVEILAAVGLDAVEIDALVASGAVIQAATALRRVTGRPT